MRCSFRSTPASSPRSVARMLHNARRHWPPLAVAAGQGLLREQRRACSHPSPQRAAHRQRRSRERLRKRSREPAAAEGPYRLGASRLSPLAGEIRIAASSPAILARSRLSPPASALPILGRTWLSPGRTWLSLPARAAPAVECRTLAQGITRTCASTPPPPSAPRRDAAPSGCEPARRSGASPWPRA